MALVNPAFLAIITLLLIAVWFLASILYVPIGKFISRIWSDAVDEILKDDEREKK